jgi:excisionase family DNA binding protein
MATTSSRRADARTYVPGSDHDDLDGFARMLRDIESIGGLPPEAELRAPDGRVRRVPPEVFAALEQVVDALADGSAVTVARNDTQMTTQQAAEFLGVSRPTLVKYLDDGVIEHDRRGRHRRVLLRDLVSFQDRFRTERRAALRALAREGQALDRTAGGHRAAAE